MARACPSTNVMCSAAQRSASQYHVNMHWAATTRWSRYGATVSRNAAGVEGTFRCTSTWPVASRMQRVNGTTIDSTTTFKGKEIATSHATLSADGKTLTRIHKGADATGMTIDRTEVYTRQ